MKLLKFAFAAALLLASCLDFAPPALAQSGITNSVYTYPAQKATYSATAVGITPASSATDLFTITGSATKTVKVTRVACVGTSTALGNSLLQIVKRSTANTGGTSSAATAVPLDSNRAAATATALSYTANPTLGTAVGVIRVGFLGTGTATALGSPFVQEFGAVNDTPPVLRGTAQVLAVNANGASLASGAAFSCTAEWTEE